MTGLGRFQNWFLSTWPKLVARAAKSEGGSASRPCRRRSGTRSRKKRLKLGGQNTMSWTNRVALYKRIEEHRKRPLIVYVTSKRPGIVAMMATDALPYMIQQLDALPHDAKTLDFLIV